MIVIPMASTIVSFKVKAGEHDYEQDDWTEGDDGIAKKSKSFWRKFPIYVEVARAAMPGDFLDEKAREQKEGGAFVSRISGAAPRQIYTVPGSGPVDIPDDVAADLIERGLVEAVETTNPRGRRIKLNGDHASV